MGVLSYIGDSLRNLVANLGTPRDKAAGSYYDTPFLNDQQLLNAYRGAWLPQKIVDIPAEDATREWRSWNASSEEISKIEAEETRLGVQLKVLDAMTRGRLLGGAAIYIGTGDRNPMEPLDPARISAGSIKHLNVMTRLELQAGERETDPESPDYNRPKFYTVTSQNSGQVEVHPSRLVVFTGNPHPDPSQDSGPTAGWGDSILLATLDAIKHADAAAANVASLLFEAKVDVIKIPGLMAGLQMGGEFEQQVLNRLQLAATAKGINGTLILDSEEDYQQKSATFTGLNDLVLTFLQIVAGAADIPVTRLLGKSPGGLNSTGEADLRNYYDHIQAVQKLVVSPAMAVLDECLIRSALGSRPGEVFYTWRSLWQTTAKERADIGKTTAETIKIIGETGTLPDEVLSLLAQNMLTESGVAPGLETAMEEFGKANPDGEEGEDEEAARERGEMTDASPRTLYVRRDVLNGDEIIAWAKAQGFETTLPAEDLHVTIAFSRTPVDWMKAGEAWGQDQRGHLTVRSGGARMLEKFGGGALVLLFNSSELGWRHEAFKQAGASWDWPEYQPHITLTYEPGALDLSKVEPYRGAIRLGPEIFEELDESWKSRVREE